MNSFHSKIEQIISKYRNVSSKYLNRYGALLSFLWQNNDLDIGSLKLVALRKLKSCINYIRLKDIIQAPDILEERLCQQITS